MSVDSWQSWVESEVAGPKNPRMISNAICRTWIERACNWAKIWKLA